MMFRLTRERELRGFSRTQLAIRIGIHPATLGKVEAGHIPAFPRYRRLLSEALGLPEEVLFEKINSGGAE